MELVLCIGILKTSNKIWRCRGCSQNCQIRLPVAHYILRPTSVFSSYTILYLLYPNTSSLEYILGVKLEEPNPLKSPSSTQKEKTKQKNLPTVHVYNPHSKWNTTDSFYWSRKNPSKNKIGCLSPAMHDVLWRDRNLYWLKVTLKHMGITKTKFSKVVRQIILSPTKRKTSPYRYVQLQTIAYLH